jgi:hypothetical protein
MMTPENLQQQLSMMTDTEREKLLGPILSRQALQGEHVQLDNDRAEMLMKQKALLDEMQKGAHYIPYDQGGNVTSSAITGIGDIFGKVNGAVQQYGVGKDLGANKSAAAANLASQKDPSFYNNPLMQMLLTQGMGGGAGQQQQPTAEQQQQQQMLLKMLQEGDAAGSGGAAASPGTALI